MKSISSREEVIQFLQEHNTPLLQCEFMMYISPVWETKQQVVEGNVAVVASKIESPDTMLITSFDCPDAGISWSPRQDKFGFLSASLKYSQLNVSFVSPIEESFSPVHKYYDAQFTEDGLIKQSNDGFANIEIFALVENTAHFLFSCSGCRFSYPLPIIDISNAKMTVFKTTISYQSFRYGI